MDGVVKILGMGRGKEDHEKKLEMMKKHEIRWLDELNTRYNGL